MQKPQFALSIRQPWAWLIVNGFKDVENREWLTKFRGPFYVHASKTMTRDDYDACRIFIDGFTTIELPERAALERGGIVGTAELYDCRRMVIPGDPSPWCCGEFNFFLRNQQRVPFTPCKGALGFFEIKNLAGL